MNESGEPLQTLRLNADIARPKSSSRQLTFAHLQRFADEFDLGRLVRMDRPLTTQCNTTDPFETGHGMFMVRIRHDEEFGERVEFLHRAITYLHSKGFPAPEVMRHRSGKTWTLWEDRIVEIHRFIQHDQGTHRDWRRMLAAATALGDLHSLLSRFDAGRAPVPPEMRNDLSPAECYAMLPHAEQAVMAQTDLHPEAEKLRALLQNTRELLPGLMDDYERILGGLPWMFVHGDYHFWNVLFQNDTVAGVVDYDFLQERERLFDVAYALQAVINYLSQMENRPGVEYHRLGWNNVRLWVDQYDAASHLPLTKSERRRLPGEILRIFLVNLIVSSCQADPVETIMANRPDFELYRWISKQKDLFMI